MCDMLYYGRIEGINVFYCRLFVVHIIKPSGFRRNRFILSVMSMVVGLLLFGI